MYKDYFKLEIVERYRNGESSWEIEKSLGKKSPTRQTMLTWCRLVGVKVRNLSKEKRALEIKKMYKANFCPTHNCEVPVGVSKNLKPYWRCWNGGHFMKDPDFEPHEGYGQDEDDRGA